VRVLLTGCAGFIGYHVSNRLLQAGHEVLGVDGLTDYYDPRLKEARLRQLLESSAFVFERTMLESSDTLTTGSPPGRSSGRPVFIGESLFVHFVKHYRHI
jgi:dTDP-D-glucose 4,6-dehydratase